MLPRSWGQIGPASSSGSSSLSVGSAAQLIPVPPTSDWMASDGVSSTRSRQRAGEPGTHEADRGREAKERYGKTHERLSHQQEVSEDHIFVCTIAAACSRLKIPRVTREGVPVRLLQLWRRRSRSSSRRRRMDARV